MSDRQDYLGKGWNFPLKIDLQGGLSLCSAEQKVRQAIPIILRTELGERRYRPSFGCRLSELTFAPLNSETLFLMRLYVTEALETWEPRIDLEVEGQGIYRQAPKIVGIDVHPLGGTVAVKQSFAIRDELLGVSEGY
ncbi:MAG: GPW/gp25 family protein [Pleurocapsa sp. MO_226.B13]|nr:GPW/gp25 family protein [Pleurocapsa sp. MO_226.B13]